MRRLTAHRLVLALLFSAIPNGEAASWYERAYDACLATAGDDDWRCEDWPQAEG